MIIVVVCLVLIFPEIIVSQDIPSADQKERVIYSMKEALPSYKQEAEQGNVELQLMLGQICVMDDIVEAGMKKALYRFSRGAGKGNINPGKNR